MRRLHFDVCPRNCCSMASRGSIDDHVVDCQELSTARHLITAAHHGRPNRKTVARSRSIRDARDFVGPALRWHCDHLIQSTPRCVRTKGVVPKRWTDQSRSIRNTSQGALRKTLRRDGINVSAAIGEMQSSGATPPNTSTAIWSLMCDICFAVPAAKIKPRVHQNKSRATTAA